MAQSHSKKNLQKRIILAFTLPLVLCALIFWAFFYIGGRNFVAKGVYTDCTTKLEQQAAEVSAAFDSRIYDIQEMRRSVQHSQDPLKIKKYLAHI